MAYEHFFEFYDLLMSDINYQEYLNLVIKYANKEMLILDLACGTGNVLVPLVENGYTVHGLDISEEMLLVTENKLQNKELSTNLYNDDMRDMNADEIYDIIYCFNDSLNYLTSKKAVLSTLKKVYQALRENSFFLFDVHSLINVNKVFDGYSYNEINEEYTYLWNTYTEKSPEKTNLIHELCFFIKENELYRKKTEYHRQVVYSIDFYLDMLKQVGFSILEILYDFDTNKTQDTCSKIIVVSKKC